MADDDVRQTVRVWGADLDDAGRKLTLDELRALEAMHACHMAAETLKVARDTLHVLRSLEGRLDRVEQFLGRIDARYPRADPAGIRMLTPADVEGRSS